MKKFELLYNFNISNHLLLYNGSRIIDDNLTFDEIENNIDKAENKMNIIITSELEYMETTFIGKKQNLENSSKIPTIEELASTISSLKEEIKEIKESNNSSIKLLKEEIKSLKNELETYKK